MKFYNTLLRPSPSEYNGYSLDSTCDYGLVQQPNWQSLGYSQLQNWIYKMHYTILKATALPPEAAEQQQEEVYEAENFFVFIIL